MHQCLNLKIEDLYAHVSLGTYQQLVCPLLYVKSELEPALLDVVIKYVIVQRLYNQFHQQFRQKSRALPQILNLYLR